MSTISVPRSIFDMFDEDGYAICVFCDSATSLPYCARCNEYKGLMSVSDWESYTGETWDEE